MREILIEAGSYRLYGSIEKNEFQEEISVISFQGKGSSLIVPEAVNYEGMNYIITHIGKKAFLGASFREVILPYTIKYIDDWAFAQCEQLCRLVIGQYENSAYEQVHFGKGVFSDCRKLEDICIGTTTDSTASKLMGAVPCRLKAEYLFADKEMGTSHWFSKWDASLSSLLDEDDMEGYTDIVLCGEEDIQRSQPEYMSDKRKRKSALCLLRLLYDESLSEAYRERYIDYLKKHCKGAETEEAWEVILSDFGDCMKYYNLFAQIGCINEQNIDAMLLDMGQLHAEAKAYLIEYKRTNYGKADVFSAFEL